MTGHETPLTDAKAIKIYSAFLGAVCPPFEAGRYEDCLNYFALPHRMTTLDRSFVCITKADMLHALSTYGATLLLKGVNKMVRDVEDARFLSPTRIEGFHVTSALRDDVLVTPAFATRNCLVLRDGQWRSTEQTGVVDNKAWHIVPRPRPINSRPPN